MSFLLKYITGAMLKQILTNIFSKVDWTIVGERFITDLLITGLRWLANQTSNDVDNATVDNIVGQLKGKRLKQVEAIYER